MPDAKKKSISEVLSKNFAAFTILIFAVAEVLKALAVFLGFRAPSKIAHSSDIASECQRAGVKDRRSLVPVRTNQCDRSGKRERRVGRDRRATHRNPYPA